VAAATRAFWVVCACCALYGCELVANFDRGKIPSAQKDAGTKTKAHDAGNGDSGAADAGTARDAAQSDAAQSDAAQEDGG